MTTEAEKKFQALSLTTDYAASFERLEGKLTQNFQTLREYDSVLNAPTRGFIARVNRFMEAIADPSVKPAARLGLLLELGIEAEDLRGAWKNKITQAELIVDEIDDHNRYADQLLELIGRKDPVVEAIRHRGTTYPHVAPANLLMGTTESLFHGNGRRKRLLATPQNSGSASMRASLSRGSGLGSSAVGPKNKKRRLEDEESLDAISEREEDEDPVDMLVNLANGTSQSRAKKLRKQSPAVDMDLDYTPEARTYGRPDTADHLRGRTLQRSAVQALPKSDRPVKVPTSSRESTAQSERNPARTHLPNLPGAPPGGVYLYKGPGKSTTTRPIVINPANLKSQTTIRNQEHERSPGGDPTLYCYCQRVSFGVMVGCDDPNCSHKWFHLGCLGLRSAPDGDEWFCKECTAHRAARSAKTVSKPIQPTRDAGPTAVSSSMSRHDARSDISSISASRNRRF